MAPDTLKRIIDKFLASNSPEGLSSHIVEVLNQEKKIVDTVRKLCVEQEAEKQRRDDFVKSMQSRWAAIQNECPHWEFDYYGDPSGNNDSHNECRLCKKQW